MEWDDDEIEEVPAIENEEETEDPFPISKAEADKNLDMAGTLVDETKDQISAAKYETLLLNDQVHSMIMDVLQEAKIPFKLAEFQLISLHVIGNQKSLILISPTGRDAFCSHDSYSCLTKNEQV